jgi:hypothetical protein
MAKKRPEIVSIEYDLRQNGPKVDTWLTVHWGVDDEMQIYIGSTDPREFDPQSLHKTADAVLHGISRDLRNTKVKPLRASGPIYRKRKAHST